MSAIANVQEPGLSDLDETRQLIASLEARIASLEEQVLTLTAAVDAASRLRLSSVVINPNLCIAGGKKVRRILEKGGLVRGYPERPRPE
jgi:hypothetical protein